MVSDLATRIQKLKDDPYFAKQFNELIDICHETAVSKGWYNPPKTFTEELCLMHSELSEALEEFRDGQPYENIYRKIPEDKSMIGADEINKLKPEGVPIELADLLIRVFDTSGNRDIPLLNAILQKMEYNLQRPIRHGNKVV